MHIAAIGFNERELEMYVSQLKTMGFESLSDVKKAEDGSYYQALAKASKFESLVQEKPAVQSADAISA